MFKSYSSKSAANKGAVRAGLTSEAVYEQDGKWGFETETQMEVPPTKEEPKSELPVDYVAQHEAVDVKVVEAPKVEAAAPVVTDDSKRTIEKDRPKQNGVTRPSLGGMCRAVWDFCDANSGVTIADVKAEAAKRGWNTNNASIEYYQWRKFHGVRGRVKSA